METKIDNLMTTASTSVEIANYYFWQNNKIVLCDSEHNTIKAIDKDDFEGWLLDDTDELENWPVYYDGEQVGVQNARLSDFWASSYLPERKYARLQQYYNEHFSTL